MTSYIKADIILHADNINLSYDDKIILRDINFKIQDIIRPNMLQGQVVSLVGRSGIGKTQLFKILSGLQQPTSGDAFIYENKKVKAGNVSAKPTFGTRQRIGES